MARIVIGVALSSALMMTVACSGSSPSSPSSTPSASPSSAFQAQTFSAGAPSIALTSHDHEGNTGRGNGNDRGNGNGHELQVEGSIASIDATHKSFVVRATKVNVVAGTIIRHGHTTLTFADLKAGTQVHVKGSANGTAVDAREINVQSDGEDHRDGNEVRGVVAGLTGTCPAITFTIGTPAKTVKTNAATSFGRAACAHVVNGARVEVEGAVQTDGSILAVRVRVEHEGDDD